MAIIITLVQTKSITQFPVVLYGKEFFEPLVQQMKWMANEGTISPEDLDLMLITDDIDEAMKYIRSYIGANYKIKPRKRSWWLLEKR